MLSKWAVNYHLLFAPVEVDAPSVTQWVLWENSTKPDSFSSACHTEVKFHYFFSQAIWVNSFIAFELNTFEKEQDKKKSLQLPLQGIINLYPWGYQFEEEKYIFWWKLSQKLTHHHQSAEELWGGAAGPN